MSSCQDGTILDVDAYLDNCGLSLSYDFESPLGFLLDDTVALSLGLCLIILIHDVILDALNPYGQWMPISDEHHPNDPCARGYPPSLLLWSVTRHLVFLSWVHLEPSLFDKTTLDQCMRSVALYSSMLEVVSKSGRTISTVWLLNTLMEDL
jgi:hypothetical protein